MNRLAATRTGRTPAYSGITLDIMAVDALTTGAAAVLGSGPLHKTMCAAMGGCAWSIADVGLRGAALGLAVSRDAVNAVIAPMVGLTGDEVMARGLVFGLVYNRYDGRSADGSGAPVAGATVTAAGRALRIVYPNNMFSGTVSATASPGGLPRRPRGRRGAWRGDLHRHPAGRPGPLLGHHPRRRGGAWRRVLRADVRALRGDRPRRRAAVRSPPQRPRESSSVHPAHG